MKWFGSSDKSAKSAASKSRKQPLMETLHSLGKDEEESPEEVITGLDENIPSKRVSSGELKMVLPKHMQKNMEHDAQSNDYMSMPGTGEDEDKQDVASAISLSTIGASIEREMQQARNNLSMKSSPPLEIKATKQEFKKKENAGFFSNFSGTVVTGLATAYDRLHNLTGKKKTLKDVPVTARRFKRDHPDLLLPGNEPRVGFMSCFTGIPAWVWLLLVAVVAATALSSTLVSMKDTMGAQKFYDWKEDVSTDWSEEKSIAFVGNSYLYVNDMPRLMQKISGGRIHQDSCLRTSASLGKLLRAGNGMYQLWQTANARTYKYNTAWVQKNDDQQSNQQQDDQCAEDGSGCDDDGTTKVYDFGSCTVFQLLEGYDYDISYKDYNGAYYYEEGTNPCFEDANYILYLQDRNLKDPQWYDYVVLNDQTARMADAEDRSDSIQALKYAYAPMIKDARTRPLIVDTHAYPSEYGTNVTDYDDQPIPYMQALIYRGVNAYTQALQYNLPSYQEPRVVPIGMAYLVVWEEDFDMWQNLFLNQTIHASPHGSYLFANVLYATVYGHLPRRPTSQKQIKTFFSTARYMPVLPNEDSFLWPTVDESDYLRLVARRVVLQGYIPQSFIDAKQKIQQQISEAAACQCDNGTEGYKNYKNYCVCEQQAQEGDDAKQGNDDGQRR